MRPARYIAIVVALALLMQAAGSRSLMLCACDAMVAVTTAAGHDCCGEAHDQDAPNAGADDHGDHDCYDLQLGLDDTLRGDHAAIDDVAVVTEVRPALPTHLTRERARCAPLMARPPPRRDATLDLIASVRLTI
ncbi:MAG: hypothetical protein H0X45_14730 [Planctomycetes bacterium]|nr:hypothetical protein [Planctomycetota bacterium]